MYVPVTNKGWLNSMIAVPAHRVWHTTARHAATSALFAASAISSMKRPGPLRLWIKGLAVSARITAIEGRVQPGSLGGGAISRVDPTAIHHGQATNRWPRVRYRSAHEVGVEPAGWPLNLLARSVLKSRSGTFSDISPRPLTYAVLCSSQ